MVDPSAKRLISVVEPELEVGSSLGIGCRLFLKVWISLGARLVAH